jgi:hypothetical protein
MAGMAARLGGGKTSQIRASIELGTLQHGQPAPSVARLARGHPRLAGRRGDHGLELGRGGVHPWPASMHSQASGVRAFAGGRRPCIRGRVASTSGGWQRTSRRQGGRPRNQGIRVCPCGIKASACIESGGEQMILDRWMKRYVRLGSNFPAKFVPL